MASSSPTIPVGYKQTEIGVIPEDWRVQTIGDIAQVIGGGTPSTQVRKYWGADISWFTPTEIGSTKYISESRRKLTALGLQKSSAQMLPKGAILLTSRAGIGDLGILDAPACTNQGFQSLVCNSKVNNEFLYYVMLTKRGELERRASGSTFLEINPSEVRSLLIALPIFSEQCVIAEALSDTDCQIQALEKLIAKKCDIKQGTMQKLLTGKTRLPGYSGEWISSLMPNICWFQEGPGVRDTQFVNYGVKLLNGTNIFQGHLYLERTDRYISEHEAYGIYSHFLANAEDIVIACSGITIKNFHKKIAVVKEWHLPLCMNTSTMRFQPKKDKLEKQYLFQYLMSDNFKQQISGKATGSAQLNFGPSHVSKVRIDLPPLTEQKAIAEILSDMDAEITALEQRLEKAKGIKQGMMQQLLTGRIRLVEPSTPVEASA